MFSGRQTRSRNQGRPLRAAALAIGLVAAAALIASACGEPPPTPPAHDVIEDCVPGETCEATATTPESSLLVTTEEGGAGQVTIDINDGVPLDCSGILNPPFYVPVNPNTYTIDATNGAAKTVTITTPNADVILDAVPHANKWSLGVCFGSPVPFLSLTSQWGGSGIPFTAPATLDPVSGEYVGLLPPCLGSPFPVTIGAPCVSARSLDSAGTGTITAKLLPGDPRTK
jgi:hypothetical protein